MILKYLFFIVFFWLATFSVAFAAESGLPQFDISKYSQQIFWLVISFVCIYIFVYFNIIPKINKIKSVRNSKIMGNIEKSITTKKEIEHILFLLNKNEETLRKELDNRWTDQKNRLVEINKRRIAELSLYKQEQLALLKTKIDQQNKKIASSSSTSVKETVELITSMLDLPNNQPLKEALLNKETLLNKYSDNKNV